MSNGRNANGRFKQGNAGGPGRPPRSREAGYLAALHETADLDSWKRICQRAISDAAAGDARARSWLSEYLLPKAGICADVSQDDPDLAVDQLIEMMENELMERSGPTDGTNSTDGSR